MLSFNQRSEVADVRLSVLAAVECGNNDRARTLLREYREVDYQKAEVIRRDVVQSYGIDI